VSLSPWSQLLHQRDIKSSIPPTIVVRKPGITSEKVAENLAANSNPIPPIKRAIPAVLLGFSFKKLNMLNLLSRLIFSAFFYFSSLRFLSYPSPMTEIFQ